MNKKLIVIGLALLLAIPFQLEAKQVSFNRRTRDKGYARTVFPQVIGDLETSVLTLRISRYVGIAQICILDGFGNKVETYSEEIQGKNTVDLNLDNLVDGVYVVTLTLGDDVYSGMLDFQI